MDTSTSKFLTRFQIPKSQITHLKKEYETAKDAVSKIDASQLKEYEALAAEVFDFFEELTGKKVLRPVMLGSLSYYFDEGFEVEEMKALIENAYSGNEYFKQNPEKFTISNLFPIRDQDRITLCWDSLSFYKSQFAKKNDPEHQSIEMDRKLKTLGCGHELKTADFRRYGSCPLCVLLHDRWEIVKDPTAALELLPPREKDLRSLAEWFLRDPSVDLTLFDYAKRTYFLRKEIADEKGVKIADPETTSWMLKKASI